MIALATGATVGSVGRGEARRGEARLGQARAIDVACNPEGSGPEAKSTTLQRNRMQVSHAMRHLVCSAAGLMSFKYPDPVDANWAWNGRMCK